MGLQLPGELVPILGMLGYSWPEGDEEKLLRIGHDWLGFASDSGRPIEDSHGHAQQVWSANKGDGIDAFQRSWNEHDAAPSNLRDGLTASNIIGAGLMVSAAVVLALKINVIVQLVQLAIEIASAIAEAVATFGASLAEIPIFKEITSMFLDQLINLAIDAVLQ
jgi:hypothetical protein